MVLSVLCTRCGEIKTHYLHKNGYPNRPCIDCSRKYNKLDVDRAQARHREWGLRNPEKMQAKDKANYAQRVGTLVKPSSCQRCGIKTGLLDKHHYDYTKPYDVVYVCRRCHSILNHES